MDENYVTYERKVMTLPYAFSLIGGMMGISFSAVRVLLTLVQSHLFHWSLIKSLLLFSSNLPTST
jgi:hypothetical protein